MASRMDRQQSFVLHERAYRETSALLELFSREHGRVTVIARGLRAAKPRFSRGCLRAFQLLECSWLQQGELGQLTAVESLGLPLALSGLRLQSALYLNELLVRLLTRHDAHPELFDAYAGLLPALPESTDAIGFALRRFEADVLTMLGYGIDFSFDSSNGCEVEPERRYRVLAEHGVIAVPALSEDSISGAALLALQRGTPPAKRDLQELRRMMRQVLLHHLGGRGLNAWRVLRVPSTPATPA